MGIKKLVTITVEAEIEIELPEWAANPTQEDIQGVNECGFSVENSDDIYQEAAEIILRGYNNCNNDVFGVIYSSWNKSRVQDPEKKSFFDIRELYVEHCEVETIEES